MPRGRFLSRAISFDEKVDFLPDDTARLLFTWMIPHLDCEGRMYGDSQTFKSIVIPRRRISEKKIEKYLTEFVKKGLILRYSVNGNQYILSKNFEKHQVGLQKSKEAQSQIPPPPPELLQSYSNVSPPQVEVEVKGKVKVEVEEETNKTFDAYKEKMRLKYSEFNVDEEWERCQIWYKDHKKKIKSPSLALGNWLRNEKDFKRDKGGQGGAHKQGSTKLPPRDGYTKPPPNPKLDRLVEQQRKANRVSGCDQSG